MGLRHRRGEEDDARPGLFARWATGEARKVTKLAYCSLYRGAAGEGDKGAMLGCHAVSVGRNFTSEYYASPSDSSPRLRHNRGCKVHRTRARCKGWTAHHPTEQRSLPKPPMSAHSIRSAVHGALQWPKRHSTAARAPSWSVRYLGSEGTTGRLRTITKRFLWLWPGEEGRASQCSHQAILSRSLPAPGSTNPTVSIVPLGQGGIKH